MPSATQIGTYIKFTPKQKVTTLAILHVQSLLLWPTGLVIDSYSYRTWGAYAASDALMMLMSLHATYY